MEQFNLPEILQAYKVDQNKVAEHLFPDTKYPMYALKRILKGESYLNSEQIIALASYIGVTVADLFCVDGNYKISSKNGYFTLSKGSYDIKINCNGSYISIFKNDELVNNFVSNTYNMTLSELIVLLEGLLKND